MASVAIQIADEVVDYLNGKTIDQTTIPCVRRLIADLNLASAKTIQVIAVPHSLESKILDRGITRERNVLIDIGVMKRAPESELEDLLNLTQGIGDLLEGHRFSNGCCVEVSFAPLYSTEIWLQQHCFFAVIVAKIKVLR